MFDQLLSGAQDSRVSAEHVTASLGLVSNDVLTSILQCIDTGDIRSLNETLLELEHSGVPARTTASQLAERLRSTLQQQPSRVGLIDGLLDVSKSQYPELKLLTTLGLAMPASSAPVIATKQPTTTPESPKASAVSLSKETKKPEKASADKLTEPEITPKPTSTTKRSSASGDVSWESLLRHIQTHHVALYSVLSKCDAETSDGKLIIYTKNAFYKKKLDDAKYRGLLVDSMHELGYDHDIETISAAKPLKDSHAASVAAIMGGGEEVSVEDA